MIVYLVRDIPSFVMYCVNGESGSSLLIESTDSMISSKLQLAEDLSVRTRNFNLNYEYIIIRIDRARTIYFSALIGARSNRGRGLIEGAVYYCD